MNFTQEQINWFQQVTSSGQMTQEQAMAALQASAQVQAPVVEQPQVTVQGAASHQAMQSVAAPTATNNMLAAFQAIAEEATQDEDHGAVVSGKPPRAGVAWLRVRGYVEIGVHQGKNTTFAPKPIALVVLELHHPDHLVDEGGMKVPKEVTIRVSKTHSQNSKFPKFFKALSRALGNSPTTGLPITHLSQAIGMGCLGEVYHNKSDDKVYANLDQEGAWSFKSSKYQDPATGQWMEVNIPPLHGEPLLFLMDCQNVNRHPEMVKQMWDSIHIDGTRKSTDAAGNEKDVSLNYYQELIAKSINWSTSETKRILDSQGCTTTFGATHAQPDNSGAGNAVPASAGAVPTMGVQQPAVAQMPQSVPVVPETVQPVPTQPVPTAEPASAATGAVNWSPEMLAQFQAQQAQQIQPQAMPQAVPQAVQQPQVVQQPSVGAPVGAPMSAADFMNQFQQ